MSKDETFIQLVKVFLMISAMTYMVYRVETIVNLLECQSW